MGACHKATEANLQKILLAKTGQAKYQNIK